MINYKNIIQTLAEDSTFNRGLRIYLEGGIISRRKCILQDWRNYKVHDLYKKATYEVKVPILHLTIDKNSQTETNLQSAINEFVSCNCEYHQEEKAICKHIVAVFADLSNEFNQSRVNSQHNFDGIFNQIQESNNQKEYQQFYFSLESLLDNFNWSHKFSFLAKLNESLRINNLTIEQIKNLKSFYLEKINEFLEKWENEKEFSKYFYLFLSQNQDFWFEILIEVFPKLELKTKVEIIGKLFKNKQDINLYSKFLEFLRISEIGNIESFFEQIIERYVFDFKTKVELAIDLGYQEFIENEINKIDPLTIFKYFEINNDGDFEKYETIIINQLKEWLYFINNENYDKIEEILKIWIKINKGISYNLSEFLAFIKTEYRKRRKLIQIIDNLYNM
jgi:hypothetical protein